MANSRLIRLAGIAAIALAAPGIAGAQGGGRVIVTPYVGGYVPTGDLSRMNVSTGGVTITGNLKQQTAAAAGLTVSYWLTDRFALEGGAMYASSKTKGTLAETGFAPQEFTDYASVWLGSAKLMVRLLPPSSGFNIRFGIGPALISHAGSSYRADVGGSVTGLTDLGAVASLCTRVPITRAAALRVRVEDYMYNANLGATLSDPSGVAVNFGTRTQHDLVFSLGLQLFANP